MPGGARGVRLGHPNAGRQGSVLGEGCVKGFWCEGQLDLPSGLWAHFRDLMPACQLLSDVQNQLAALLC